MPDNHTFDRSNPNRFGAAIPFDGEAAPETDTAPAPRTGPGAFRPGDHVRSLASKGKAHRRAYAVTRINGNGTLELRLFGWPPVHNANPYRWERWERAEEMAA